MVTVINYGLGNLGSIQNMLKKVGEKSIITSSEEEISKAEKLILPGVGAFDTGMSNLHSLGLIDVLNKKVLKEKTPVLGICLGLQLMTNKSEEGKLKGLGWFDAETIKFSFPENDNKFKIPFMGWNYVRTTKESRLFMDMHTDPKFYLVHSYFVKPFYKEDLLCVCEYSMDYATGLEKDNIFGVQFHPEKSHKYGIKLFQNFINL